MITQDLGIATAYGYAKSKGYTGTEAEFAELMASYASTAQTAIEAADRAVEANTAAQSAKTDASASASTASIAAQTATSKASVAVTAAGTATTKASEASQSATSASQSAESAGTSAQTATTAATTATTKASEASESAATATAAKTDAETARDAAAQSASEAAASAESIDPETLEHKAYGAYVVESASGAIASFPDGADSIPMKDVLVHIELVQAGSGDPSPENVRPITGWTRAKVTRCGKNLLRLPTIEEINNATSVVSYKSIPLQLEPNTTYYLYTTFINGYTAKDKYMYCLITPSADRNVPWVAFAHSGNDSGKSDGTLTTGDSGMMYLRFYGADEQLIDDLYANAQIQLEKGSTATSYEPYSGQTYDITFPSEAGTVYGGTLDVTTGRLIQTYKTITLNNINRTGFDLYSPNGRAYWYIDDMATFSSYTEANNHIYTDSCVISSGNVIGNPENATVQSLSTYTDKNIYVIFIGITDITEVDEYLAEHPIQLVYPLAEPIIYQLTPQEITSLLGANNVWADTGNTKVEYRASTKMYIDKKITEAVSALS